MEFSAMTGSVELQDLAALADRWLGQFDALSAIHEPNSSIYWECASDLLKMIGYSQA